MERVKSAAKKLKNIEVVASDELFSCVRRPALEERLTLKGQEQARGLEPSHP